MLVRTQIAVGILTPLLVHAAVSVAASLELPSARNTDSVFSIRKSENRNEVHYGIRVDANCLAVGSAPVYAYWRMNERGGEREPLLDIEQGAYGLAAHQAMSRSSSGSVVSVRIRSLSNRSIEIVTSSADGTCRARARTNIQGSAAWLDYIYVQLRWPFGIHSVHVAGERIPDQTHVEEILKSP